VAGQRIQAYRPGRRADMQRALIYVDVSEPYVSGVMSREVVDVCTLASPKP